MGSSKFPMLLLVMLALLPSGGCGGSGTGGGADPLAQQNEAATPTPTGPGAVASYALSLTTIGSSGTTTVGANSTVIATATLKDSDGNTVVGQPIRFEEVTAIPDDAGSVTIPVPIVPTSSGIATTFLNTADTTVNKDVIIKASTSIAGTSISAVSIFKIVRSTGNYIDFITTKETTDPDGNLNVETVTLDNVAPSQNSTWDVLQLAPFRVLDKNGIPRTQVPVKVNVYSVLGGCRIFNDSPEAAASTVTTDNKGLGVFNSYVTIAIPAPGTENSCSIIYMATTPDPYATDGSDLFSYGAYIVKLKNEK